MNLQEQTIQQKQAIVALRPELERRYAVLHDLLETCTERDVDLWRIELARGDVDAVLNTMMPRIVDPADDD